MEQIVRSDCLSAEGVELVRYRIEFPRWGTDAASAFYESVADRACDFCRGALLEQARDEYLASSDPKKRFHFPTLSYLLTCHLTYADGDLLSVRLEMLLRRRGIRSPIATYRDGQVWQTDDLGTVWLLPPEQAVLLLGERSLSRRERRKAMGIWVEERRLVLLERGRRYEIDRIGKNV